MTASPPRIENDDALLSSRQLAELRGESLVMLSCWRRNGDGPPFIRFGPTNVGYPVRAYREWVADRTTSPPARRSPDKDKKWRTGIFPRVRHQISRQKAIIMAESEYVEPYKAGELCDLLEPLSRPAAIKDFKLKRFAFDVNRYWDSPGRFCVIHFHWEVDHGQTLLFGPSGTDLRLRRAGAFRACCGTCVRCQRRDGCAVCGGASGAGHCGCQAARQAAGAVWQAGPASRLSDRHRARRARHHTERAGRRPVRDRRGARATLIPAPGFGSRRVVI